MIPAHSDCGPSSLYRRIACPGSRNAERGLPDISSGYAAEGTVFHEIAALCLEFGLEPDDFLDFSLEADGHTFVWDESFAKHLRPGIERVHALLADCDAFGFERRVDISSFTEPGQFGTTDVWGVNLRQKRIKIHDWKYGEGVAVDPEGDWQTIAYALGIWSNIICFNTTEGVTVEIVIDQMRRPEGGGRWIVPLDELINVYAPQIKAAVAATHKPNAPRHAGVEQCMFCKAKGRCPELARHNLELVGMKFDALDSTDPIELPPLSELTPEQISAIIRNKRLWSLWMNAVHETAIQNALQGNPPPGLKAVPGRAGHRLWVNEEAAKRQLEGFLGEFAYERKLVSPAKAEKKLTKAQAEDISILWTQRETKPSLVPIDDPRETVEPHSAKFEVMED